MGGEGEGLDLCGCDGWDRGNFHLVLILSMRCWLHTVVELVGEGVGYCYVSVHLLG